MCYFNDILCNALSTESDDYIDFIAKELKAYKEAGGNSICEVSFRGAANRPVSDLKKMSELSGVNIICCTGLGDEASGSRPQRFAEKKEDELKALFEDEIFNGIEGTGIKPGVLKAFMTNAVELDHLRALARISKETDMGLEVHVQLPITVEDIVNMSKMCVNDIGMNPKKLLINHINTYAYDSITLEDYLKNPKLNMRLDNLKKVLDVGVNISFDLFGNNCSVNNELMGMFFTHDDYLSTAVICQLLEKGYASQLMLGHDMASKACCLQYGGYGYTRVPTFVDPTLRKLGYDEAVELMTVKNPTEFLAY